MESFIKNELTDRPPKESNLHVGDTVNWKNGYGITFKNKVIGFNYTREYNKEYKCFVHLDTDAYWFPYNHKKIQQIK